MNIKRFSVFHKVRDARISIIHHLILESAYFLPVIIPGYCGWDGCVKQLLILLGFVLLRFIFFPSWQGNPIESLRASHFRLFRIISWNLLRFIPGRRFLRALLQAISPHNTGLRSRSILFRAYDGAQRKPKYHNARHHKRCYLFHCYPHCFYSFVETYIKLVGYL